MDQDFMKYEICKPRDPRFIKMLVNEYNATSISLHDLSVKYHTDARYQFKIHNIPSRSKGEQRALTRKGCLKLGWDGKEIKDEYQAYITGLLLADGYVSDTQAGLRLKAEDKKLLEEVKNYFSPSIKLQCGDKAYSFVVSSKQFCANIQNLGVLKSKTSKELHIPEMDSSLYRHFIRGFFDGDGTIYRNNNNGHVSLRCNLCSTTKTILDEISVIMQKDGIIGTINKETRKGLFARTPSKEKVIQTLDMYRLFIRRKEAVEKLYHFLYDNSTIYMERKRKVFESNYNLLLYKKKKHTPTPS